MSSEPQPAISIRSASKSFGDFKALDDISFDIMPGEITALLGPSGSGKSTLLRLINGLIPADAQKSSCIKLLGKTIQDKGRVSRHARKLRARTGFVFQQFNLVPRLSVHKNVMVGALNRSPTWRNLSMLHDRPRRIEAMEALQSVGLAEKASQRAGTLSGGQKQRVAIARAIMQQADIILADEPIASLDPESAKGVMELLRQLCKEKGKTILVSLHQVDFAKQYCDRIIALKSGQMLYDLPKSQFTSDQELELYSAPKATNESGPIALQKEAVA